MPSVWAWVHATGSTPAEHREHRCTITLAQRRDYFIMLLGENLGFLWAYWKASGISLSWNLSMMLSNIKASSFGSPVTGSNS